MPTIVKKSIGTGKDYETLAAFLSWLWAQRLITNDQMVIGEVYTDQTMQTIPGGAYGLEFRVYEHDFTHYALIRPAPGLGATDLMPDGTEQHYGTGGVTLTATIPNSGSSSSVPLIRGGVVLENFRIRIFGGPQDDVTVNSGIHMSGVGARRGQIRACRFYTDAVGAKFRLVTSGEYTNAGELTDNIFFHTAGKALSCVLNYKQQCERNIFVRTGTAVGYPATSGIEYALKDNIYIGCGPVPALGLPAAANAWIANNYTDTAMTTAYPSGFTVKTTAELVRDPATDVRPPANFSLVGMGSTAARNTFSMFNKFRGLVPDVGPFQSTNQPLPPPPTAKITGQTIVNQNITVTGTMTDSPFGGSVTLKKIDGTVVATKAATLKTGTTWEAAFTNIAGGDYQPPIAVFSNYGGDGPAATDGAAFNIFQPIIPVAVIQKQFIVGDTATFFGTVDNVPLSASISCAVGGTPNGAVAIGAATTVYFDAIAKTFVAYLYGVTPGNYLAPEIKFTNNAGTSPAATGGAAFTVVKTPTPSIANVNVQMIGKGQTHSSLGAFQAWQNARTNVPPGEVVLALVTNYVHFNDVVNLTLSPVGGGSVIVRPAPGLSVLDRHPNDGLNWYDDGMEMLLKLDQNFNIRGGVSIQGFRIKILDMETALKDKRALYLTSFSGQNGRIEPGPLKGNHIWSDLKDVSNHFIGNGEYLAQSLITDNLFVQEKGQGRFFLASSMHIERNTFVRRGESIGSSAGRHAVTYDAGTMKDNIFLGCGPVPVVMDTIKLASASNLVDTAMTTQSVGFTLATTAAIVQVPGTNYKPKAGGPAIGTGSPAAVSTGDMTDRNRGPVPDIGCWQLTSYIPVPKGTVTSQIVNGTTLRLSGVHSDAPEKGYASVGLGSPADGASALPEKPLVLTDSGWSVEWTQLQPGNYAIPVVYMTNSGGRSANFLGGAKFTVVNIKGNPRAAALATDAPPAIPPEITMTKTKVSGNKVTIEGTVKLQNDPLGKVEIYIDPLPSGPSVGPVSVPTDNGVWSYIATVGTPQATIRVVATAYDIPVLVSTNVTLLRASGSMALPSK